MKVKLNYEETVFRTSTIEVDDQEFLAWIVAAGGPEFATVDDLRNDLGEDLEANVQEFLEDGPTDAWRTEAHDLGHSYDEQITSIVRVDS